MKLIIEMQDMENYAAHQDGFTGEYHWKYKIGTTYVINDVDVNDLKALVEEVSPFICQDNDYFKSYIADWYVLADNEDTEFVKDQKEYGGDWDTIYLPSELKKNSKGVWFEKRGYMVGKSFDSPLAGQFVGWIDNLATGECVMKIEGDTRSPIVKEAA